MAGFTVTPEQLAEISAQLRSGSALVEDTLSQLAGAVSPLETAWTGSAHAQFEVLWEQWQRDAAGLQQALVGIAQLTANAAQAYESTETSIASSFTQA